MLLLACGVESAASLQIPAPRDDAAATDLRRRVVLKATALTGGASALGAASLFAVQLRRLLEPAVVGQEWQDPLAGIASLRSPAGDAARLERRKLEREWQQLRDGGSGGRSEAEAAFAVILRVRRVLGEAESLVREQSRNWKGAVEAIITPPCVAELEGAATLLASSPVLSADARETIGWQWGACGWRRCGAQADAAQAMSKLRVNLGMSTPAETLFYLDVAKRAVDEVLLLGAAEGLVARSALPRSEYLSPAALDDILAVDEEEDAGYPGARKVLGTRLRGEKMLDLEEGLLLEDMEEGGLASLMDDDGAADE